VSKGWPTTTWETPAADPAMYSLAVSPKPAIREEALQAIVRRSTKKRERREAMEISGRTPAAAPPCIALHEGERKALYGESRGKSLGHLGRLGG
jgi:hypothetical protein